MANATLIAFSIVLGALGVFTVIVAFAFQSIAGLVIALAIFVISVISLAWGFREEPSKKEKASKPVKVEAPVKVQPKAPTPPPTKVETQFKAKTPAKVGVPVKVQPKVTTIPVKSGKPKSVKPNKSKILPPNTVYCPYCGKQIPKNSVFCPNCGSSIE
ncbi:MAG: zinc-ribbon domain-containing protein [Candidatus Freyarchaeum deiterrae]